MNKEKTRILAHLPALREAAPRHLWVGLCVGAFSLFGMVAAFGTAPTSAELQSFQKTVVEQLAPSAVEVREPTGAFFVREERIQRGDTVAALLARLGVQDEQAFAFLRQQRETQAIFRQLRPGKLVTARTGETGDLQSLVFPLNGSADDAIVVERIDGQLRAIEQPLILNAHVVMKSGEIRNSLFGATDAIGLPDGVATQLADIFGGDIDFHRDLRQGDRFSVVYEVLSHQGQPLRTGRILAAEFVNDGNPLRAIWFEDGETRGYFSSAGKNIRKAFLRSPLEFSRISSGFTSSRFHPILQSWRAHRGVDYAAPIGTRVKATGDGVVDFVGRQGGYGNLVIVRHQSRYSTHYGHLNGFAPGLRKGMRISQGDVIGYVGKTGWATGPHLHYEFRINNAQQNPLAVSLPSAPPLAAQQIPKFRRGAEPFIARLDRIRGLDLALLD